MTKQGNRQFLSLIGFILLGLAVLGIILSQVFPINVTYTQHLVGWNDILREDISNGQPIARIGSILDMNPEYTTTPISEGFYATHFAALSGRNDVLQELLDRGASVDQRGGDFQATPLVSAIQENHLHTVVFLLDAGADPNLQMTDGTTPLDFAISNGSDVIKQALADRRFICQ